MIIVLTGNIAAGKSSVSKILESLGCHIIDADKVYYDLTSENGTLIEPLKKEFGSCIIDSFGNLDRRILGKIVFSDPDSLKKLNKITHPAIMKEIMTGISECSCRYIVVEVPLLFEDGCMIPADMIWAVDSDISIRIDRLMKRNSLSKEEALRRIEAQKPIDEKKCDVVIDNSGDTSILKKKVKDLFIKCLKKSTTHHLKVVGL